MTLRTKPAAVAVGSILVIAASVCSLVWSGSKSDAGSVFHERVGRILGEQTAALLGNQGQVVVITLDPARFPIFRAQLKGFRQALRERGRIRVVRQIILQPEAESAYGLGNGLSAGDFLKILGESRPASAIVSLVGVPSLHSEQIRQLSAARPRVVAEAKFGERLRKLLDHQVVQVAVVPRFVPVTDGAKHHEKKAADQFNLYFQVVKAPPPAAVASETTGSK